MGKIFIKNSKQYIYIYITKTFVEGGWIRTNDGYPIDLQSTALDLSATASPT